MTAHEQVSPAPPTDIRVTLYQEQTATVTVHASPDSDDETLTELALAELDKSRGAEWTCDAAWLETREVVQQ